MQLKCRECCAVYDASFRPICDKCFGPLDVIYEYEKLSRETISARVNSYWRYHELLPIENPKNRIELYAGMTPLVKADNLGKVLGLNNLYIKNDTMNPTFSFKDRPAGVAVSKALEFKMKMVGCASTGNLASATAAYAARANLKCKIFIPNNLENGKMSQMKSYDPDITYVDGIYDDANTLASREGDVNGIGMVNINMRPYYVEGSKTLAFEVAEQLGWKTPDHLVIPIGSGAMLNAIYKGFTELEKTGLINDMCGIVRPHAAQPSGCSPVCDAFEKGSNIIEPVEKPNTIAKSLAIGAPGDGKYVLDHIQNNDGSAVKSSDLEIINAIRLLAKTEGIYTEPAGGVTVSALKKLAENKLIDSNEITVIYITGSGLKV